MKCSKAMGAMVGRLGTIPGRMVRFRSSRIRRPVLRTLFPTALCVLLSSCDANPRVRGAVSTWAERHEAEVERHNRFNGPPLCRVVASDTGELVPDVLVCVRPVDSESDDVPYKVYATNEKGVAVHFGELKPGRYEYTLAPHPKSRFLHTFREPSDVCVVIDEDGASSVPVLVLNLRDY
ncbi:MAG: hypothetical protein AAF989_12835 [Planctomycetota bacterium]